MTNSNKKNSPLGRRNAEKKASTDDANVTMVPLFSRRSIIILASGLIVGILLALGYWLISPLFATSEEPQIQAETEGTGLLGLLGIEPTGPYKSAIKIQVVNPGSTYLALPLLQQFGEYYAAKAGSLPFLQFLVEELEKYPLETEYTIENLGEMIIARYDYKSELPTIIVSAIADTMEEAAFFAGLLPQAFHDYLIAEEQEKRENEYQNTLNEMEAVKAALYEAQLEFNALGSLEIFDNPSYISLSAKVTALQQEFDNQASLLTLEYYSETDLQTEYENTLDEISETVTKLTEAELELVIASGLDPDNPSDEVSILILDAKIRGLTDQLDILVRGDADTIGLTQLIASGINSGSEYDNVMIQVEQTAEALAEAQQEYDELFNQSSQQDQLLSIEYRLAQLKVDTLNTELSALQERLTALYSQIISLEEGESTETKFMTISLALRDAKDELEILESQLGYDSLAENMEYTLAKDKVTTYADRLNNLTNQLGALVGNNAETVETGYLVAGNPSFPTSVLPQRAQARNILIMGAILGLVVAWLVLNFRWLKKSIAPSGGDKPPDEED